MASNKTQHYQLSQWEASDKVERLDFNADNEKIDAALHDLAQEVANKADRTTVSGLTSKVNTKAEQSALDTLAQTHTADVAALRSENCWVKLAETVLTQAASEVVLSVPNAGQLHKVLLEYSAAGAPSITVYFLTQTHLNNGTTTSFSVIALGSRNNSLAVGSVDVLPAGSEGRLAAFGRYLSIDSSFTFEGTPSFYSRTAMLFDDLAAVRIEGDKPMSTGSRFVLYGMKK